MNFNDVINTCSLTSEKTQDVKIKELTEFLSSSLIEAKKPVISLVSFTLNHSESYELVSSFTGIDIPSELRGIMDDEPACVIFDYSDKPGFMSNSEADDTIIYGLPSEKLKTRRIAIIDSILSVRRWLELSGKLDVICLLINATMAMNQSERVWLESFAKSAYPDGNLYIALTRMNSLNSEEDVFQVRSMVSGFLSKHNIRAQILQEINQVMDIMQNFLSEHDTKGIHDRRVSRVVLRAVAERVRHFMDEVFVDDDSIISALKQLEKQRKLLELSGEAVSDGLLRNLLNGLMVEICDGLRDYSRQMSDNINSYIEKASIENLKNIDEKINSFIKGTWEDYFNHKSREIDKKFNDIAAKLMEQMDIDAGDLIGNLDEQTRRTIYSALNLEMPFVMESISSDYVVDIRRRSDYVIVDEITDRLRRETRNMMLLSIPFLFINPLISAGNILAAKLIEKFRMSGELKELRSEIKRQVEDVCFVNVENIVRQIQDTFKNEINLASENVKSAYGGLIKHLEDEIIKLKSERDKRAEARVFLEKQLNEIYPKLEAELEAAINLGR